MLKASSDEPIEELDILEHLLIGDRPEFKVLLL